MHPALQVGLVVEKRYIWARVGYINECANNVVFFFRHCYFGSFLSSTGRLQYDADYNEDRVVSYAVLLLLF